MPDTIKPVLTPEEWEARDYRQPAKELDAWVKTKPERRDEDDATEYVAKLGLRYDDSVVLMNRAHDRVVVPPPARGALAAFALAGQPFGFTARHVTALRRAAEALGGDPAAADVRDLADRLAALVPPGDG